MAAFGKTRRRRELPLKSGLKKVERQLCADSGHLCGVQNLGLDIRCIRWDHSMSDDKETTNLSDLDEQLLNEAIVSTNGRGLYRRGN